MRIISGSARGTRLSGFTGTDIRPTPDRVREAAFSILLSRLGSLAGLKILDLYAGTGALALEALSRGAALATLIDRSQQSARTVEANARACRLAGKIRFIRGEVSTQLPNLVAIGPYDLIFLDPPYHKGLAQRSIAQVATLGLLAPGGVLCAECAGKEEVPQHAGDLILCDSRNYGLTAVHFFIHSDEGDESP